jgi:hypothetical protein
MRSEEVWLCAVVCSCVYLCADVCRCVQCVHSYALVCSFVHTAHENLTSLAIANSFGAGETINKKIEGRLASHYFYAGRRDNVIYRMSLGRPVKTKSFLCAGWRAREPLRRF